MHPIRQIKEEQKELARAIRVFKASRKQSYTGPRPEWPEWMPRRYGNPSVLFRVRHIAYCELRGRTREQIEPKVRDEAYVKSYINPAVERQKEEFLKRLEIHHKVTTEGHEDVGEAIRASA